MARGYNIFGQSVRSNRKPIVARMAPSRDRPREKPDRIKARREPGIEARKDYGECVAKCVTSQRECRTDAVEEYKAANSACRDNRSDCITECKKPLFSTKEK